jgi:hypothetical protein
MKREKRKPEMKLIFIIFFSIFLGITVGFILLTSETKRRVLFFYNDISQKVAGSEIGINNRGSSEKNIEATLSYLLAGPRNNAEFSTPFQGAGRPFLVKKVGDICYVDIKIEDLPALVLKGNNFRRDFDLISKTVRFNFPGVKHVVITINGQEPYLPPYS